MASCASSGTQTGVNSPERNSEAWVTASGDLPIQAIAARPRFIAEREPAVLGGEAIDHFGHRFRAARNFADKTHFSTPPAFGDCNRDCVLVRIHGDVSCRKLFHGSFPMREALADSPANPRSRMPWNEPPTTDIASHKIRKAHDIL
jgi:hypothetical protein